MISPTGKVWVGEWVLSFSSYVGCCQRGQLLSHRTQNTEASCLTEGQRRSWKTAGRVWEWPRNTDPTNCFHRLHEKAHPWASGDASLWVTPSGPQTHPSLWRHHPTPLPWLAPYTHSWGQWGGPLQMAGDHVQKASPVRGTERKLTHLSIQNHPRENKQKAANLACFAESKEDIQL